MAKVVKFPVQPPEKFDFRPVRKPKEGKAPRSSQLPLFGGARIVQLNHLTAFEEALFLDEQGDARAADAYRNAIAAGDSTPDAYCNLGILESRLQHHAKAIDCFTLALKEDPRHFEAHYNLANLYAEIGNLPLAKVHYQLSIEIEPEFPNGYFNLGLTLAMNKEYNAAVEALSEYKRLSPQEESAQVDELIENLSRTLRT